MAIFEDSSRLEPEDHALVLVGLTLPFPSPNYRAPLAPVRDHVGAEHIFLDCFGGHQGVPDLLAGGVDLHGSPGDQILAHACLLPKSLSERPGGAEGDEGAGEMEE